MGFIIGSLLIEAVVLFVTFIFGVVLCYKHRFSYWKRKNVFQFETIIPFGSVGPVFRNQTSIGELTQTFYMKLKKMQLKYGGYYALHKPVLLAVDPDLVKQVLTKNFQHFHDRDMVVDEERDPISKNMFNVKGIDWRFLRTRLSPTFTSGKLKMMYETFLKISEQLVHTVDKELQHDDKIDVKEILARYSTDVIGSTAFGLDCNSLTDPNAEFRKYGKAVFSSTFWYGLARLLATISSKAMKLLRLRQFDKETTNFFMNSIKQTIEYRENNRVDRKDLIDLLIRLKNNEKIEDSDLSEFNLKKGEIKGEKTLIDKKLTLDEIAAHSTLFFLAGFETSSSTMSFCLFELAQNPEIQEQLREEINENLENNNGKFTYDAIMNMSYLNKVVKETLRKYPVLTVLNRKCVQDFKLPDDDLVIEKGTTVFMPVMALQRDPEYFPDPLKFDPERFSPEEIANRNSYTYLPFGEGPRNCIGMRFGLLQTKLGLATMLRNYQFTLDPKTELPLKIDTTTPLYAALNKIWLRTKKIS